MRHLVLGPQATTGVVLLITVACQDSPGLVPYDRTRHTYLTMLTDCTECLVLHAAWREVFVASLGQR